MRQDMASSAPRSAEAIDPVTLELIKGAVQSARHEMEALVDRTAMSPFIREKKDYFTAFFDRTGRLVSSTNLPMAAGNLIDCIFEHYPAQTMQPGDVFLYNDAYGSHGAVSHMPDMVFVSPVFADGRLFAFAEVWGHLWDIGGMHPGSISPDATDIFQEGVVMPPVRVHAAGVENEEVLRIFLRNTRYPDMVRGDITALMACVRLGRRRMEEIVTRFGLAATEAAFAFMLRQSESALRKAIAARIPDGRYSFRDWIDSDAVTDRSYSVAVTIDKQGERLAYDFSDSSDQAVGAINFIMEETVAKFMTGLFLTLDDPAIQMNAGFADAIAQVTRRPGSIVDPRPPAPIGMRSHTMIRVNSAIFGALARATGGQCSAASAVYVLYYLRSFKRQGGDVDLCIEGLAVGFGARTHADGLDAVYYVAQKNYPVEFAEMEFGVRVEGYALHCDSGGPGRWRGGCGIVRDIRVIADEAVLGVRMDNVRYPAWGVNGGRSGQPGHIVVNPGSPDERVLKPLSEGNRLRNGDLLRIVTAGGGGWGSPLQRPAAQVLADVLDGFVSPHSARHDYGVVISDDGATLDVAATQALRAAMPAPSGMFHRREYFDEVEPAPPAP
jgi:N-methylhydantoinase B